MKSTEQRALATDALLDQLTLEEQVSLLAGADLWRTVAIPRLGLPVLKVTDGPAGARGGGPLVGATKTAAFPVGIALGSSWNTELLQQVGLQLAREAQDKGARVLLAPTLNLFRSSLNGRNFENYSEDPHLTGTLGTAYVQALQSGGVAATVKHFVGNESEYQRNTISSDIPERALRELYLRPFEMTVKEGGAWAVMTGYNRLNGTYCSDDDALVNGVLRREWGFTGLVMSDWGGTYSSARSLLAGLDLEMPGPSTARADLLEEACQDPSVYDAVREAARRVLCLIAQTGTLDAPLDVDNTAERAEEHSETRALIRRAGAEGAVLLKNEGGLLPLPAKTKVAVIGPNAATAQVMGGGSAQMNAHRRVSPLDGLRAALGEDNVTSSVGCENDRYLPTLAGPVYIEYFVPGSGERLASEEREGSEVIWFSYPEGVDASAFHARLSLTLCVSEDGEYELGLLSAGRSRLQVDGEEVIDNWTEWQAGDTYFGFGSNERRATRILSAGTHQAVLEVTPQAVENSVAAFSAVRLGFRAPLPATALDDAVRLAAEADFAVVCVGTNGHWETEGVDRVGLDLPGRQDELVRAVVAANPRTVVLLQTGGPVLMPWLEAVPAVLQAWFPGQEAGHSMADVLLGHTDPGGRLPQTFPARLEDDPTHPETPDLQYPGEGGHVEYREGMYTGYRHVDRHHLTPMFPFGFGLSYSTFALSDARLSVAQVEPGGTVRVSVRVTNTGDRRGQQVVQVYVRDVQTTLDRPTKELKAFCKVSLDANENIETTLHLDMRSLAYYDPARRAWVADAGEFEVLVGTSSVDLPLSLPLTLTGEWMNAAN